ncbi:MAG: hypothetical protein QM528_09330, partial [Phycisphaerales bacterium]|nr:hypothetical protein [Phycisphaerales bacterium]
LITKAVYTPRDVLVTICDEKDNYRFGFNSAEKENEIAGIGNTYDLGARMYNARLGKMFSPDPKESIYPWQSTYAYFKNSPIAQLDFDGEGDYYDKKGSHLGNDGKKDNLAYTSTGARQQEIMKNGKGTGKFETIFDNAQKLSVTNSVLNQYANTVAQESSGDATESYAIASAISNLANANYKGNIYNTISAPNQMYGFTDGGSSTAYNNNAESSMGAAINALTGGTDFSNGAIRWDGFDLAARGFNHPKAINQGVYLTDEHIQAFKSAWSDKLIKAYSSGKYTSFSPSFKVNTGYNYVFKQATKQNIGMVLYSSSAVHGRTLFWKANEKFLIQGADKATDVNKGFKGKF